MNARLQLAVAVALVVAGGETLGNDMVEVGVHVADGGMECRGFRPCGTEFGRVQHDLGGSKLGLVLGKGLLHRVDQRISLVASIDRLAARRISRRVCLGVFHHAVDFFLGQTARSADGDRLLLTGAQVLR